MPDIRETGVLDDFSAYPGTQYETTSYPIASPVVPWYTSPGSVPVLINNGGIDGSQFPPVSQLAFYSAAAFGGPTVETWGLTAGDPALSDAWRWGMYTVTSVALGKPNGYQALHGFGIGGIYFSIRRYDDGTPTEIAGSGPGPGTGGIMLLRRNGNDVECWMSADNGANWTLMCSATDTNYVTGPFYFVYGDTGVETGWTIVGGGIRNRSHIYRWLPGIRVRD
jgi:hypothetical protein